MGFRGAHAVSDYRGPRSWDLRRKYNAPGSSAAEVAPQGAWYTAQDRTIFNAPAGEYLLVMTLNTAIGGGGDTPGYCQLQINGVDKLQIPGNFARHDLSLVLKAQVYTTTYEHITAGNAFRITSYFFPINSPGFIETAGTSISVAYLG